MFNMSWISKGVRLMIVSQGQPNFFTVSFEKFSPP